MLAVLTHVTYKGIYKQQQHTALSHTVKSTHIIDNTSQGSNTHITHHVSCTLYSDYIQALNCVIFSYVLMIMQFRRRRSCYTRTVNMMTVDRHRQTAEV